VIVFVMIAMTIVCPQAALGEYWVSIGCAFGGNSAFIPSIRLWEYRGRRHAVGREYLVTLAKRRGCLPSP
jgi:hypothetical protein